MLRLLGDDRHVRLYLGQLKTLFGRGPLPCLGGIAPTWDIPDVLDTLGERLGAADAELLETLALTLDDRAHRPALDAFGDWTAAPAVPLDVPWPEGMSASRSPSRPSCSRIGSALRTRP